MRISNLLFVALAMSRLYIVLGAGGACIPSGTDETLNVVLNGPGDIVELCANAIFLLDNPIRFTAPNQAIYTTGLPTGSTRAILRVHGVDLATAITSNYSGTVIKNIEVDGSLPALGTVGRGGALIEIGGDVENQVVDNVYTHDPRGWSCLHIIEGTVTDDTPRCQNAIITNNQVGPSGTWNRISADGIALACGNSLVENNTITDATDGAIRIFGAPGSIVKNNLIIAETQILRGGITMMDYAPMNGNYNGTQVLNNTINAQGAFIKVGIAMGPQVWSCSNDTIYWGTVSGNTLTGAHFGYGFPVSGVSHWTVSGNIDNSRHVGVVGTGCGETHDRPAGFQYEAVSFTILQSEYMSASIHSVLEVTEPTILAVVTPATTCGIFRTNEGLLPGQSVYSCDGRFELTLQFDGNLVLTMSGTVLFETNTYGSDTAEAIMQGDGNFVLYNSTGVAIWDTSTWNNYGAIFRIQDDGNLVIYSSTENVLWNSGTCCH